MKKSKRIISIIITLAMALTLAVASVQAASDNEAKAMVLKQLNLFQGTDSGFQLERAPSREEALVMFIRLLGEEGAAKQWSGKSPFTDVAAGHWVLPYVGYAFDKGYTKGLGDGTFGLGLITNAQAFTTFVLRGLGFDDSKGDFTYAVAINFGKARNIIDSDVNIKNFTRGDAVSISLNALNAYMKGSTTKKLSDKLIENGVFTQESYESLVEVIDERLSEEEYSKEMSEFIEAYEEMMQAYNLLMENYDLTIEWASAFMGIEEAASQISIQLAEIIDAVPVDYLESHVKIVFAIAGCADALTATRNSIDAYNAGNEALGDEQKALSIEIFKVAKDLWNSSITTVQ